LLPRKQSSRVTQRAADGNTCEVCSFSSYRFSQWLELVCACCRLEIDAPPFPLVPKNIRLLLESTPSVNSGACGSRLGSGDYIFGSCKSVRGPMTASSGIARTTASGERSRTGRQVGNHCGPRCVVLLHGEKLFRGPAFLGASKWANVRTFARRLEVPR